MYMRAFVHGSTRIHAKNEIHSPHCTLPMIISKKTKTGAISSLQCYWDGANDPVYLHICRRDSYDSYDVVDIKLFVHDCRVYALTFHWSIMLYDSTVPGDEANIAKRIKPYCHYGKNLIVKIIHDNIVKKFSHADGAIVVHGYYHNQMHVDRITTINGTSICHQYVYSNSRYKEFNNHNFSDTVTHEMWYVSTQCTGIDRNYYLDAVNSTKTKSVHIHNDDQYFHGIVDDVIICSIYSFKTLTDSYVSTSIYDTSVRHQLSLVPHSRDVVIHGYFIYVLVDLANNMFKMYIIDVRNGYTYEFTHGDV